LKRAKAAAGKLEQAVRHPLLPQEARTALGETAVLLMMMAARLDDLTPYLDEELGP